MYLSLLDNKGEFVGADNYGDIFTDDSIFSLDGLGDIFTSRLFVVGSSWSSSRSAWPGGRRRQIGGRLDYSDQLPLLTLAGGVILGLFAVFTVTCGA